MKTKNNVSWSQFAGPNCDNSQLTGLKRSESDLSHTHKQGRMPGLLRLNSVGESSRSSHERLERASQSCSKAPNTASHIWARTLSDPSVSKHFAQSDKCPINKDTMDYLYYPEHQLLSPTVHSMSVCSLFYPSHGKVFRQAPISYPHAIAQPFHFNNHMPTIKSVASCDPPPRILSPSAVFTALPSVCTSSPPMKSQVGSVKADARRQSENTEILPSTSTCICDNLPKDLESMLVLSVENKSQIPNQEQIRSISSCVDNSTFMSENPSNECLDEDSVEKKSDTNDSQKYEDESDSKTGQFKAHNTNLKRRSVKEDAATKQTCSLASVIDDLSNVLFQRKAPKKGRPSCQKRRRRRNQNGAASFTPQVCSSPKVSQDSTLRLDDSSLHHSASVSESSNYCVAGSPVIDSLSNVSFSSSPVASPCKSGSQLCTNLFFSPADSESDDSDLELDGDSIPHCPDPICRLSSFSVDAIFKQKCLPRLETLLQNGCENDTEIDQSSYMSPSPSPLSSKAVHLSISVSLSEEENDDSVEWEAGLSQSPPDHVLFDFKFYNGLSLNTIIGGPPAKCAQDSAEKDSCDSSKKLLLELNAKWNKIYPSFNSTCDPESDQLEHCKVQFASDDSLVQVHYVGNEERRGTWYVDGERFKKRIEEVGKVVSPVLSESHRANVLQRLESS